LQDINRVLSVPNLPFFYLVYRAWSHWRALSGGQHLQFLLKNKLISLSPSAVLAQVYQSKAAAHSGPTEPATGGTDSLQGKSALEADEDIILSKSDAEQIACDLDLPEVEVELERAIWQGERARVGKIQEEGPQKGEQPGEHSSPSQDPSRAKSDDKKSP
jgi:hypothetical protein